MACLIASTHLLMLASHPATAISAEVKVRRRKRKTSDGGMPNAPYLPSANDGGKSRTVLGCCSPSGVSSTYSGDGVVRSVRHAVLCGGSLPPWSSPRPTRRSLASPDFSTDMNEVERVPVSGSILEELDRAAADKLYHPDGDVTQESEQMQSSTNQPFWDFLQQVAVCVLATIIACGFLPKAAHAVAENSIGASTLGLKVAEFLRGSGLSDEVVVLVVAMLPVLELRGAIPVGYWLKLAPIKGYILAVIGNMIPVPFIVLFLEKISNFGKKSETGQMFVHWVFERTRKRAGPIEEFQWLGLLLFVAVPLPGTGAWTGAIAASILGMPFWDAMTANFLGVVLAGLLVNVFVVMGRKEAFIFGTVVFASSFFMWSLLRLVQQKKRT